MILNKCDTLKKNVINVWGDKGTAWLEQLPKIIEKLSSALNIDYQRLLSWIYLRTVISA